MFGVKSSLIRDAWLMPTDSAAPHCQWLKEIVLPASAYGADADRVKALDPRIVFSDEWSAVAVRHLCRSSRQQLSSEESAISESIDAESLKA
jgi:hypothetical protein